MFLLLLSIALFMALSMFVYFALQFAFINFTMNEQVTLFMLLWLTFYIILNSIY